MWVLGALGFALGLTLFVLGAVKLWWMRQLPKPPSHTHWTCPDEHCDWAGRHARYLVSHIMRLHPQLVPPEARVK